MCEIPRSSWGKSTPRVFAIVEGESKLSLRLQYRIKATIVYQQKSVDGWWNHPALLHLPDSLLRNIERKRIYPWLLGQRTESNRYEEISGTCGWFCCCPRASRDVVTENQASNRHELILLRPGQTHTLTTNFRGDMYRRDTDLQVGGKYCFAYGGSTLCLCLEPSTASEVSVNRRSSRRCRCFSTIADKWQISSLVNQSLKSIHDPWSIYLHPI